MSSETEVQNGKPNGDSQRLTREQWLAQALDVLTFEGNAKLRVDRIAAALGVTKGSFYWHFRDRDDFVRSLVEYWSVQLTETVFDYVQAQEGDARNRLYTLMTQVSNGQYARYDVSVRAWAAQEPAVVSGIVEEVDRRRLAFATSLFAELGFEGPECEMRARTLIAYLSFESSFLVKANDTMRAEMLNRFFAMIIRHCTSQRSRPKRS